MAAIRTAELPAAGASRTGVSVLDPVISAATAIALLGIALLPLLMPYFIHPALELSSSHLFLNGTVQQANDLSDETVRELVLGPGTFAFIGPAGTSFFTPAEAAHLREARTLLIAFEALALVSIVVVLGAVARSHWNAVRRGAKALAVGVVVIGVVGLLAFEPAFEWFHRIFFPGGNWAFDSSSSHLVQLYPETFWQITSGALGLTAIVLALLTWLFARHREGAKPA